MAICDLVSGVSRLQKATKELQECWGETRESWQDRSAEEFQQRVLQPLLPRLRLLLGAVHELNETLDKAERDCRDEMRFDGQS